MSRPRRVAVVPGVLALRPEYASLVDPVPALRAAVEAATAWADEIVQANGSARRTHASPGPYDDRAVPFDDALYGALTAADHAALRAVDQSLAKDLWAETGALPRLADALESGPAGEWTVSVDYDDAPYGVAWWVVRYESTDR